jgi:hypothetical protein
LTGNTGWTGPTGATGRTGPTGPQGSSANITASNVMSALNSSTNVQFSAFKDISSAIGGGILLGLDAAGGGNGGIEIIGGSSTNLVYIDFSYPNFDYVSRILADLSNGNLTFMANGSATLSIDGISKA